MAISMSTPAVSARAAASAGSAASPCVTRLRTTLASLTTNVQPLVGSYHSRMLLAANYTVGQKPQYDRQREVFTRRADNDTSRIGELESVQSAVTVDRPQRASICQFDKLVPARAELVGVRLAMPERSG